jgi:hypothetical protein
MAESVYHQMSEQHIHRRQQSASRYPVTLVHQYRPDHLDNQLVEVLEHRNPMDLTTALPQ